MQERTTPLEWFRSAAITLQWPVIVTAAFWLGRYVRGLEERLVKSEARLDQLLNRHLPAVHRALAEIRGLLMGMRK